MISITLLSFIFGMQEVKAQGPPIFTDTPIMLGLEGRGIRTFGRYINKENVKVYLQPFAIPYNLTAKWQVGTIVPFASVSPEGGDSRFGLGDIKVFTKYQLVQKDGKGKTLRSLIKITETFPTGNTEKSPPIGAGVYQTSVGLVNGYVTTRYGIYTEVAYNIVFDDRPDNLIYNIGLGVPLLPQNYPPKQINVFLEFTGNYFPDSKSNHLFIAPGIQWINGKRFLLETGIQLPLVEEVSEGLKTNFIYTLGTRILLF